LYAAPTAAVRESVVLTVTMTSAGRTPRRVAVIDTLLAETVKLPLPPLELLLLELLLLELLLPEPPPPPPPPQALNVKAMIARVATCSAEWIVRSQILAACVIVLFF
jgi:hypothetical protein